MAELTVAAEHRDHLPGATSNQALARGLHILRMLVDESEPMTATEIARRLGLHQSSASRILATLTDAGYVRKNDAGRFVPDYGVLALASATTRMPLISRPRAAFDTFVSEYPDLRISMCMLWRDEMIYLLRAQSGSEPVFYWSGGYPLNISAPGLRLLLDLPQVTAQEILVASRQRLGWGGRPELVPQTEDGVLAEARRLLRDDVLILDGWFEASTIGGAIPIVTPEPHPVAIAIVDPTHSLTAERLTVLLHQARRLIEHSFTDTRD